MRIHLHIDRIVLDSLEVEQLRVLKQALQRKLAGELKSGGLSPELRSSIALPGLRSGSLQLGKNPAPARLGAQIAGAVYRCIGAGK